jgi:hypothetical protein
MIDESVKNLSVRLVRADSVGTDHDEGEVPLKRHAGIRGYDCEVLRRGHLLHGKVLTW